MTLGLTIALLAALPSPSPSSPSYAGAEQHAFDAAIQRETLGQWAGAADDLEKLARDKPSSSFADDALFEAAVLCEERLSNPSRAQRLYQEVATRYPQSRLARRARARADFLALSLRSGEAPLMEYQRILSEGARDPRGAATAMERLLAEHPDFSLTDRALFWLASRDVEIGRELEAARRFVELEKRFPSSEWARRSYKSRADLLLKEGRTDDARALYQTLSQSSDAIAHSGGMEGLAAVHTAVVRRALVISSLLYLTLFVACHLLIGGGWRRMRRIPTELVFYLPVAALFALAGASENPAIGRATGGIAVGGALITWVTAAGTAEKDARWAARVARALALAAAVLALAFVAVQWAGLSDLVIETMRAGPER